MYNYRAPLQDFEFTYFELMDYQGHLDRLGLGVELNRETVLSVLQENASFCQEVLAPLNAVGDTQGCRWEDGSVVTPAGFKQAYSQYAEGGWTGLSFDPEHGGQGLPESLQFMCSEACGSANWSWYTYPALARGAKKTLAAHGTPQQKRDYLAPLISGMWTATMCLTEAHCGTDLGLLRTRAEPLEDGSYAITGSKIFITVGEHDMAENIIHLVLARLTDAPPGIRGLSLFLVPKYQVANGVVGERNAVHCGAMEHKLGLKGSATCALNFEGARGELIGQPHKGLQAMFVFMNAARLGAASQGVCHAEVGLQKSAGYAQDRLQMRSLTGPKNPGGPADPIIVHPDVRRMLLTQKCIAEGGRMLIAHCALLVDIADRGDADSARAASDDLSFLTPIAKGFLSELGLESANLALQCFGGHGYIREWGLEQNLRDARIASLYEGTTGIQALDLLVRKVLASDGRLMEPTFGAIDKFCENHTGNPLAGQLARSLGELRRLTREIKESAEVDADETGAASVDYLMCAGYVLLGWFWARAAARAQELLETGRGDPRLCGGKIHAARFYFARILPRTTSHAICARSGAANLMSMPAEGFIAGR